MSNHDSDATGFFTRALKNNHSWCQNILATRPAYFTESSKGQAPKILWIGCADSRIPETTILGLEPGQVFTHRNIANILTDSDLSSLSVIEYAVRHLKVEHAVVCGHTLCGGVNAALGTANLGVIDPWLQPLKRLSHRHADELARLQGDDKSKRLSELNILQSLETLKANPTVMEAIKVRGLEVHGVLYDLASGKLSKLETGETQANTDPR